MVHWCLLTLSRFFVYRLQENRGTGGEVDFGIDFATSAAVFWESTQKTEKA